jgi:hypothetical protein
MTIHFFLAILIVSVMMSSSFILTPTLAEHGGKVPDWVRDATRFWISGLVTDDEFLNMMKYIVDNNIIIHDDMIHDRINTLEQLPYTIERELEEIDVIAHSPMMMEYLKSSNKEFTNLPNIQKIIEMREEQYDSYNSKTSPFMSDLLSNDASKSLIHFMNDELDDGEQYVEISVSNSFGVDIAMTGKTDDYVQSDEGWWMITISDGSYVNSLEYDLISDSHGTFIAKKITDENGEFLGIIQAFVSREE